MTEPDATFRPTPPRLAALGIDELDAAQQRLVGDISDQFTMVPNLVPTHDLFDANDLARIVEGPSATGWSPREDALLRAVDELHERVGISNATWTALAAELDERQLVELPMLVGQYRMIASTVHALGVQPEVGSALLPRHG